MHGSQETDSVYFSAMHTRVYVVSTVSFTSLYSGQLVLGVTHHFSNVISVVTAVTFYVSFRGGSFSTLKIAAISYAPSEGQSAV